MNTELASDYSMTERRFVEEGVACPEGRKDLQACWTEKWGLKCRRTLCPAQTGSADNLLRKR